MAQYVPPLRDMHFVLHELFRVTDEFKLLPRHADVDVDTINAVLEEGGKFAAEVIFPLNISGDGDGCVLDPVTHEVRPPQGFKRAYEQFVEGGWPALSCDPEFGGQGLPVVINQCFYEMLNSANQAWTMYPGLSHGAYECLREHGTPEEKAIYLPKLPAGSKGISLFVVPKYKVRHDGSLGERNPIFCTAVEHKMGIHGSATCQINLDGATGTLVGQPHKGLAAMFVMMPRAAARWRSTSRC